MEFNWCNHRRSWVFADAVAGAKSQWTRAERHKLAVLQKYTSLSMAAAVDQALRHLCCTRAVAGSGECITLRDHGQWWGYEVCPESEVVQFHDVLTVAKGGVAPDGETTEKVYKREVAWSLGLLEVGEEEGDGEEVVDTEELEKALERPATDANHAAVAELVEELESRQRGRRGLLGIRLEPIARGTKSFGDFHLVQDVPALTQRFTGGQPCDETGAARHSTVHYVCMHTYCELVSPKVSRETLHFTAWLCGSAF